MSFYVKVSNGVIVEGPKELQSSESSSPNVNWSKEQMKLNGYFIVDMSHDHLTEKVDTNNPTIMESGVTFPRIQLSAQDADTAYNASQIKKRVQEYPSINDLTVALWELIMEDRPQEADAVQLLRVSIKQKYPKK